MDYYLNRFKSKVSFVAAQVSHALPGNPIFREYEIHEQVATAGPGLSWKIYSGTKNTTKQSVSIWLFEKKQIEKWPKQEREAFPELLKKGVAQLTKLRHPRLLVVEKTLEESRDTFAFCTEPIFSSLANIFDFKTGNSFSQLHDFKLLEIEIQHGLFQLSEALVFLHNDAKILHGNICPSSIIVNEKGAWKLCGFDFCIIGVPLSTGQVTYKVSEWDRRLMANMNPELDYASPEIVEGVKCNVYADIFSLGMLACTLFNNNKVLYKSNCLLDQYKQNIDKLKQSTVEILKNIPDIFKIDVKACLNFTPELRPDAIQFTKVKYFDDYLLKVLNCLDSLMQMDNTQKMQFFKGLTTMLQNFPKRVLLQKIFPYLVAEFNNANLLPFILPNVFLIAKIATNQEFSSIIFPPLTSIFNIQKPYQTVLILLQNIPMFLQKSNESDIKKHVLPIIYNSLSYENPNIQELCLSLIPTISKLVDKDAMKTQLLPKILHLILEANVLSIRVQALICLSKMMPYLEKWMVFDQILPTLPKINSKEPGILMAVLGIYKLAFEMGISTEQCARSILPFLISSCVENTLNLNQFEQYVALIYLMFKKVEKEQRQKLHQLSASQEEQRNINFEKILNTTFPTSDDMSLTLNDDLNDLASTDIFNNSDDKTTFNFSNKNDCGLDLVKLSNYKKDFLSLEEKKQLAAEQEKNLQSRLVPSKNITSNSSNNTDLLFELKNDFFNLNNLSKESTLNNLSKESTLNNFANKNSKKLDFDYEKWTLGSKNGESKKNDNLAFIKYPPPPQCSKNLVQKSNNLKKENANLNDLLDLINEKKPTNSNISTLDLLNNKHQDTKNNNKNQNFQPNFEIFDKLSSISNNNKSLSNSFDLLN